MSRSAAHRSLSLESLEVRQLMAADTLTGVTAPMEPTTATVATASISGGLFDVPTGIFDRSLTATVVRSETPGGPSSIQIDGSDYEDRIMVRDLIRGGRPTTG